jgi:hypothetical protein
LNTECYQYEFDFVLFEFVLLQIADPHVV